ncbi:hypothetical protein [Lichenibacterium ramalinae]|uniref:hypothetical protein n=1 Tax=Lichenibacterium ramalinae TaxID=2316527 RepID=UPI00100DC160|nr:hypothetical protein [Lichenibacterium ramalinae]
MAAAPFTLPLIGEVGPYWIGVIGSLAVEAGAAFKACSEIDGHCPERYKRIPYLLFRAILALVSGTLPVVMDAQNSLTAFYLGASAPLILDRLAKGVKPGEAVAPVAEVTTQRPSRTRKGS